MVIILKITLFRVALAEHPKRKYLLREQHWDGWLVETALWSQVWRSQTHWSGSFSFAAECLETIFVFKSYKWATTKWICEISIEILFRSQKDALKKKTPIKLRLQLQATGHLRKRFRFWGRNSLFVSCIFRSVLILEHFHSYAEVRSMETTLGDFFVLEGSEGGLGEFGTRKFPLGNIGK